VRHTLTGSGYPTLESNMSHRFPCNRAVRRARNHPVQSMYIHSLTLP
jgi:hypothetical protein